jgi:hypothetical protein
MLNFTNVMPRSEATWASSWITTPGDAGLVMTTGVSFP